MEVGIILFMGDSRRPCEGAITWSVNGVDGLTFSSYMAASIGCQLRRRRSLSSVDDF